MKIPESYMNSAIKNFSEIAAVINEHGSAEIYKVYGLGRESSMNKQIINDVNLYYPLTSKPEAPFYHDSNGYGSSCCDNGFGPDRHNNHLSFFSKDDAKKYLNFCITDPVSIAERDEELLEDHDLYNDWYDDRWYIDLYDSYGFKD